MLTVTVRELATGHKEYDSQKPLPEKKKTRVQGSTRGGRRAQVFFRGLFAPIIVGLQGGGKDSVLPGSSCRVHVE